MKSSQKHRKNFPKQGPPLSKKTWETTKRTGHPNEARQWGPDTLPVGKLTIPSIGLEQIILGGELNEAMGFGPVLMNNETDKNIVIAAHRDSFFSDFGKLKEGDVITLELIEKNIKYRINNIVITDPEDTRWMDPDLDNTLTLITCYPFNFVGDAPKRYVVVANTF